MKHRLLSLLLSVAFVSVISSFVLAKPTTEENPTSRTIFTSLGSPHMGVNLTQYSLWQQIFGLDPVRFTMRASKDSVKLGEEFEITIKAELLPIPPSAFFVFDEQKSFSLKLILPEGFVQTGGDYYDYIGATLTTPNQPVQYIIKGFLSRSDISPSFMLLRGPKDGNASSIFEKKGEVLLTIPTLSDAVAHNSTRLANACNIPTPNISLSSDYVCSGFNGASTSTTITVSNCQSFEWNNGNGYWSTGWNSITVSSSGNYRFRCIDNNLCSGMYGDEAGVFIHARTATGNAPSLNGTYFEICPNQGCVNLHITNSSEWYHKPQWENNWGLGNEGNPGLCISAVSGVTTQNYRARWIVDGCPNTGDFAGPFSANAHFSASSTAANWVNTGTRCVNGKEKYEEETDMNSCSSSYGHTRQGNLIDACGCADRDAWWSLIEEKCVGTEKRKYERDVNPCSPTSGTERSSTISTPRTHDVPTIERNIESLRFCAGSGSITLSVQNQYKHYQWSTGESTSSITLTSNEARDFDVSVRVGDSNECDIAWSGWSSVRVSAITSPNVIPPSDYSIHSSSSFCSGQNITLSVPQGFSNYEWTKNNAPIGENSSELRNVNDKGTYSVRIGSSNECGVNFLYPVSVFVNSRPDILPIEITNGSPTTFCDGGSVTLSANSEYNQYSWSTGSTSSSITVSTAGSYSVTGSRSNECGTTSNTASKYVTVLYRDIPTITPTISGPNSFCNGTSFQLKTNEGYSHYEWTREGIVIGSGGATLSNLNVAGKYRVKVGRNNECGVGWSSESAEFEVTANSSPNVPPTPGINASGATTFCQGGSVTLSSATTHNLYEWSNGSTSQSIFVNASGNYQLRVADVNQCGTTWSAQASRSVTVHPIPSFSVSGSNPTTCNGTDGIITLQGLVANTAYTVNYSKNSGSVISTTLTSNGSGSITIAGLTKGSYTGIQVSLNGCSSSSASITLSDPSPAAVSFQPSLTSVCIGASVALEVTNTVGATYTWSVSPSTNATLGNSTTRTNTFQASAAGSYTITVIQTQAGCSATATRIINVIKPNFVVTTIAPSNCSATDGSLVLDGLTGNTTYQIKYLKNGAPASPADLTSNAQGKLTIASLTVGQYTDITATQNGCISDAKNATLAPAQTTVVSNISPSTASICVSNSLALSVNSVQGASYAWNSSPTTGVNLTVSNNNATFIASTAGIYTVSVTQTINGCTSTSSRVVTVNKPVFTVSTVNPVSCNGTGTITLNGLTPNLTYGISYVKNGGSAITSNVQANAAGQILLGGPSLTAGTYSAITATYAGCTSNAATATLTDPVVPNISVITASDTIACSGTSVNLSVTNVAGAAYVWSVNVSTGATLGNSNAHSNILSLTEAGTYVVSVTQTLQGCSSTTTKTITCQARPNFSFTKTQPTGCSEANGSIILTGLTPSQSYTVSYMRNEEVFPTNQPHTASTNGDIVLSGLNAGIYVFQTSYQNCVSIAKSTTLSDPSTTPISPESGSYGACVEGVPTQISVINQPGASYFWRATPSLGATLYNEHTHAIAFTASIPGNYTVDVIQQAANGCTSTASFTINVNQVPSFTASSNNPTGCGTNDGSITLSGLVPYTTYQIAYDHDSSPITASTTSNSYPYTANASGQIKIENLGPGNYSNLTASLGICHSNAVSLTLVEPTTTISALAVSDTLACRGSGVVKLNVTPVIGATYSWSISPGSGASLGNLNTHSNTLVSSALDTYTVSVTQTVNGCTASRTSAPITFRTCSKDIPKFATTSKLENQSICYGASFEPVVAQIENDLLVSYQWDVRGAFNEFQPILGQTSASLTALPTVVGEHEYRITVVNTYQDTTIAQRIVKLRIKAIPPPVIINANNTLVCAGDSSVLTAPGCIGGSIVWSPNNDIASGNQLVVRPIVTTVYTAACNLEGCLSEIINSATVSVNPQSPPIPKQETISYQCGTTPSITLTASGCATSNGYAWYQSLTDTTVLSSSSSLTVAPPSQLSKYYYVACKSTGSCKGVRIPIEVFNNSLFAPPVITATALEVCPDSSITLTVSGCSPVLVGQKRWTYSNSSGNQAGTFSTSASSLPISYADLQADTTFYTVKCSFSPVNLPLGNTSETCFTTQATSLQIAIVKKPFCCTKPELTEIPSQVICQGGSFLPVNTQVTNGVNVTWQWYNDNGTANPNGNLIAGQTSSTLATLPTTPGVYKYRVVASNSINNPNDSCFSEQRVTLTLHEGAAPVVTASKLDLCPGESVTLTAAGCSITSTTESPVLTKVRVLPRDVERATAHTGAYIEGSNDMVNWTVLGGPLPTLAAGWNDIAINNATSYRYLRYSGAPAGHGEIAEIEFYAGGQKLTGTIFSDGKVWANAFAEYDFKNAFDDNPQTIWISQNAGIGAYIGIDTQVGSLVTWNNGLGTGNSITFTPIESATYFATCNVGGCVSPSSNPIVIRVAPTKPTPIIVTPQTTLCSGSSVTLSAQGCATIPAGGVLTKVSLYPQDAFYELNVGHRIQGSNDRLNWTDLREPLPQLTPGWNHFDISTSINYRYLRLLAGPNSYGAVMELEFYSGTTKLTGPSFSDGRFWDANMATNGANNAFDGNLQTQWYGAARGAQNTFVGIDTQSGGTLTWSPGGQNTASITISPTTTTTYSVTCNVDGCTGTASQAITVVSTPILSDIANQSICSGGNFQTVQTSVTNGADVTWQWYNETSGTSIAMEGQTTATLTQLPTATGVYKYKVVATSQGSSTCQASKLVTLTITSGIVITQQPPSSVYICANASVTLEVKATGNNLTYQWQRGFGSTYTNVSGATAATLTLANVSSSDNGYRYRCVVSSACGSPVTSSYSTFYVGALIQSANPTVVGGAICLNALVIKIKYAAPAATEYNINFSTQAEALGFVDTGWQPITTADTILVPTPPQLATLSSASAVTFSLQVRNGTCTSSSNNASITFNSTPTLQLVSGYPTCDVSLTTYTVRVSVSSGTPTSSVGTVSNVGTNVFQISNIPINQSAIVTLSGGQCSRKITIDPPTCSCPTVAAPTLTSVDNVVVCQGQPLPTFKVTAESGKIYNWYAAATGGIPLLANNPHFSPTLSGTYYVEAQISGTSCRSTRVPVVLTINAVPSIIQGTPVCQALTYNLPLQVSAGGVLTATHGNISGSAPNYQINNVTKGVAVTLTATAQGCSTVTVLPVTVCGGCVNPTLATIPAQEICMGANFTPVTTSVTNGVAVTYQWYNDNGPDNATTQELIGQTSATLTALPTAAGVYRFKIVATNTANGSCMGTQTVTLTIHSMPWIYLGGPSCFPNHYDIAVIISNGATLSTTHGLIVGAAPNHALFNVVRGTAVTLTASAHGCSVTTVLADTICGGCVKPVLASIPSQTICQGDTLTPVTANITNGVAASLQWYNDNGTANPTTTALNGQTTATLTALPTTAGVYKYKLVAFNGVCRDSQTVTLTIKPMPWIYLGGPSCFATYYDIATVISEGATLATSHGNIVGEAPNHAVFNIIKGTTVTLTATHNGCTTTTVLPASICGGCVIPQLAAIPSQTICQGDTLEPVGSSITNGVSARLQWFNDNGAANPTTDSLSGQNTPILTALPTTPGVFKYKLVATNTTYASCVGTQTVTITINETPAAPTISFAASSSVVCPDSSVTLTASGCATTVNWHYTRANGSTATLAATEASVTIAYNTIAGTPTDSLTFRATCAGTCAATLYSNALLVLKKALCDTVAVVSDSACYVYIKASNAQGEETTSLPRLSGTLQPLKLQADDLDSTGFWNTGVTYLWTRPDSTTTTTDTLVASTIGEYKLLVSKQGRTCEAYVTLNAKPCVVRDYTSASCQTVTITNPTATNQLSSLVPGDVFYAADYSIHVTEASGGAGGWSGKGYVEVLLPLGVTSTVAVTFSGIAINDCYELTNGTVETEYDPNAGGILDVDDALAALNDIKEQLGSWLESFRGEPTQIEKLQKTILPLLKPYKDDSRVAATIEKFKNLSNVCDTTLSAACKSAIAEAHAAYDSLQSFIDELPPFPTYLLPGASTAVNGRMAAEGPDVNIITIAALDACANAKCSNSADPVRRYWGQVHAPWYEFWSVTSNGQKYYVMRTYESLVDVVYYYVAYGEKQYKIFKPARGTTAADAFADAASNLVFNIGVMIATGGAASATETVVLNVSDAFISALEESKDGNFDDFKKSFATNLLFSSLDFAEAAAPVLKNFYNKVKPNLSSFNQVARNKLNTLRTQTGWIAQVDAYKNTIPARVLPNYSKVLKGTLGAAFRGLSAVGAKIDHKNKQILDAAGNTIATFQNNVLKFTERAVPAGWTKKSTFHEAEIEEVIDGVPVRKKTDVDVWTCPTYVAPRGRASAESDCIVLKIATGSIDDLLEIARKMLKDMGQVGRANDKDVLYKIVDFINPTNPESVTALQRLGGIEHLKQVLRSNPYAPCCGGKGNSYFPSIAEHLGYLRTTLLEFGGDNATTGFSTFMKTLKNNPAIGAQDGSAHALKKLAQYKKADVVAMEGKIAEDIDLDAICTGCLFDIKLTNGTFIELKSYKKETLDGIASSTKFINQFKQYLQSLSTAGNDIKNLRYVFNGKKVTETEVKEAFVKLFKNKSQEIFDANEDLFRSFGIQNPDDLSKIKSNNPIFEFIETN